MPSRSSRQAGLMAAVAAGRGPAGIPQNVGVEFHAADKASKKGRRLLAIASRRANKNRKRS